MAIITQHLQFYTCASMLDKSFQQIIGKTRNSEKEVAKVQIKLEELSSTSIYLDLY